MVKNIQDYRGDSVVKKLPANAEDTAQWDIIPGWENMFSLQTDMSLHKMNVF